MLKFASGAHERAAKYGGSCNDPAWTFADKTLVQNQCANIVKILTTLILVSTKEEKAAIKDINTLLNKDRNFLDVDKVVKWQRRVGRLKSLFVNMKKDLGTGGKTITFRKAMLMKAADEISAITEFKDDNFFRVPGRTPDMQPTWDISVNANTTDKNCFFNKANSKKVLETLFHELTHLYGTEDKNTNAMNDAHVLDDLVGSRRKPAEILRIFLQKQRSFTLLGDQPRLVKLGGPINLKRLKLIFGANNAWDKITLLKEFKFIGPPSDFNLIRKSDGKLGSISFYFGKDDKPLYFFNFR